MTPKELENYYPGKGCKCEAHGECECACGANWTPKRVYEQQAEIDRLKVELEKAKERNPTMNEMLTTIENELRVHNAEIGPDVRDEGRLKSDAQFVHMVRHEGLEIETLAMMATDGVFAAMNLRHQLAEANATVGRMRELLTAIGENDWATMLTFLPEGIEHRADQYNTPESFATQGDYESDARYIYPARDAFLEALVKRALSTPAGHDAKKEEV